MTCNISIRITKQYLGVIHQHYPELGFKTMTSFWIVAQSCDTRVVKGRPRLSEAVFQMLCWQRSGISEETFHQQCQGLPYGLLCCPGQRERSCASVSGTSGRYTHELDLVIKATPGRDVLLIKISAPPFLPPFEAEQLPFSALTVLFCKSKHWATWI